MSGRYVFNQSLKELRFLLCQTSEHSAATRTFLHRAYPIMKKNNPNTPILMREALDTEPRVFARYGYGVEKRESLAGLSEKEIEDRVTGLVKTGSESSSS